MIVRLWEVKTGKEVHAEKMTGHTGIVKAVTFAQRRPCHCFRGR